MDNPLHYQARLDCLAVQRKKEYAHTVGFALSEGIWHT